MKRGYEGSLVDGGYKGHEVAKVDDGDCKGCKAIEESMMETTGIVGLRRLQGPLGNGVWSSDGGYKGREAAKESSNERSNT